MISLLDNKDDYQFNVLLTPGLYIADYSDQISSIVTNTQNRGDSIFILDGVAFGSSVPDAVSAAASQNTSYAASYWPWVQIVEPSTGNNVWVPPSTVIAGVYAYNDSVAEPWFAPAGINRGGLSTVIRAEKKLAQSQRDTLYTGKVNPIATFPGTGVVVYGQKTLQSRASALDRVNVRRLLIALKSYIGQVANNLVFEQNTIATRNQFLSQVNPYLTSVQQRQGLYAYKVVMDDTNNTPDVIDRNELVGAIYIQPVKTAEFIYLNFNITPTGASFPA
jgi:phage tail sheath protein FI